MSDEERRAHEAYRNLKEVFFGILYGSVDPNSDEFKEAVRLTREAHAAWKKALHSE